MAGHFPHLLDPRIYPDDARRHVRVPGWDTFEHRTQFATLRDLAQTAWREDLVRYVDEFRLGRVIWPLAHLLHSAHVDQAIEEIRRRRLYLFDLWSYVPGSSMDGIWSNITPPPGMVAHLQRSLGDRFLGMDNGEQDGRYIWATGQQQCPSDPDRVRQYRSFQRHFQALGDDLGHHLSALVSLTFGHYFLKEGNHVLLGAETAQALPNSQLYYAFIRGAGRQYGVPWFGNASVFNRWGWKDYGPEKRDGGYVSGPERGTSLSLLKRLLYTHYLYNCVIVGFESGWLQKDAEGAWSLTPIGRIQRGAVDFVERHGQPGVMHAPAALMLDFHAGWAPPRHLYTSAIYQVWGGLPYDGGDHLTHGVLSLLFPGYEDASYFRDERGFLSPTPFGDMTDVLLSDAPLWVLRQYALIILAGAIAPAVELRDKLLAFVEGGGHLLATAANARALMPELGLGPTCRRLPAGAQVRWADGSQDAEDWAFDLAEAAPPPEAQVQAVCDGTPAVIRFPRGAGAVTLILAPLGLPAEPVVRGPLAGECEKPLPAPYPLLRHARRALERAFAGQQLLAVSEGLGFITCRKGAGDYTLGVFNPGLSARPMRIESRVGRLTEVREIPLDSSEKGAIGHWPDGLASNDGGANGDATIAGGDIRLFAVRVEETGLVCCPPPSPPPLPRDRFLALRGSESIQDRILARPTFFQHFDGVKVDWTYLRDRDPRQLDRDQPWLARQRVRIAVDFSSGLNLFPDLTLLDNYPPHTAAARAAMDDVLEKMTRCGAHDAVITLHRAPENHWSRERAQAGFVAGVRDLCRRAALRGVTVHLQPHPARWLTRTDAAVAFLDEVGAPNLRVAVNTGHAAIAAEPLGDALARAGSRLGGVMLSAPRRDGFGQVYDAHAPVHGSGLDLCPLAALSGVIVALDGVYACWDDEYQDAREVERLCVRHRGQPASANAEGAV